MEELKFVICGIFVFMKMGKMMIEEIFKLKVEKDVYKKIFIVIIINIGLVKI